MSQMEMPGTEHADHVAGLMSEAHSYADARIAHGEHAVQGDGDMSPPYPDMEPAPPAGSGVDTDPFADPGSDAEEAGESAREEEAERQAGE
jgi:hypothetical protein